MTDQLDNQLAEQLDYLFPAAQQEWDLVRLYQDLAKAKRTKGKGEEDLSPMEKLHLRGLLCGHSPTKLAKILGKKAKGLHVDLSKTLYPYLKDLLNKEEMENWRNFRKWLEEAGYKKIQPASPVSQPPPPTGTIINISNVRILEIHAKRIESSIGDSENYIDVHIRLGSSSFVNSPKKDKQD
jgi:hypothetical protein